MRQDARLHRIQTGVKTVNIDDKPRFFTDSNGTVVTKQMQSLQGLQAFHI
jgi:hypothetical protein